MIRLAGAVAALAAAFFLSVPAAQTSPDIALQNAALAWDRGDYTAALTTYQQLLDSPAGDQVLEPIALQTGELYRSTELTTDGAAPQFSPDGKFITYETGAIPSRRIRLLKGDGSTTVVAELQGSGAAFSVDSTKLAYLKLAPSDALNTAYAEIDKAPQAERLQRMSALAARVADETQIVVRDLASGQETTVDAPGLRKSSLAFGAGNRLLFGGAREGAPQQIYAVQPGQAPAAVTTGDGDKIPFAVNSTGDALIFTTRAGGGRGAGGPGGGFAGGRGGAAYSILTLAGGTPTALNAADRPAFSADGKSIAYVTRTGDEYRLMVGAAADAANAAAIRKGPERLEAPSLSPDGTQVAFEMMPSLDWEVYTANRDGSSERRLTREIQHDLQPVFLSSGRILAVMGEARHRRSYLYDPATGARTRLFHNNTVRTIAPEYSWTPSADGTRVLIVAERDGDTVSVERGVYLMDLTRKVTRDELKSRVASNLAAERALRAKGQKMFGPIASEVKAVVADASVSRVYNYEKTLFDFDSKHITRPGNRMASSYLFETYKSFGYEPQLQWFDQRTALDGKTANVIATLRGTVNPELVYVVSSHYDSVAVGPGADDDSSGTSALLEAARIMAKHPQPATIMFASFTGEEAGLLGSREFVRQAVANRLQIVGALNNDMIGWANDHRLDNTIRYSNPGIRDVQHNAASMFTNMITYDALYYKSTDAAAYYEAYGDIVGGIGSYPVLGNPHYHQPHDFLETINHQLVTEVAKTTAATLMLLASSPSRLSELKVDSYANGTATLSWKPSLEKGVTGYIVAYGPADRPEAQTAKTAKPSITLPNIAPGTVVNVKAVNAKGMEGWDWARMVVK